MDAKLGHAGALVMGGLLLAAPTRRAELDHVGAYNFTVEIEGISAGYFKGVDGLSSEVEVITERVGTAEDALDGGTRADDGTNTGDGDLVLRKRPGRTKYGDITLKKGYIDNPVLLQWFDNVQRGAVDARSMRIRITPPQGSDEPERVFDVTEAWPKAWRTVNGFDGKGNDVVTEEITFVVETLDFG